MPGVLPHFSCSISHRHYSTDIEAALKMHFQNIFVQVMSFFLVGQGLIHALPTETASLDVRASVPCDDISKYTLQVSQRTVDIVNSHFANPSFNLVFSR